jgi:hypothetical protein
MEANPPTYTNSVLTTEQWESYYVSTNRRLFHIKRPGQVLKAGCVCRTCFTDPTPEKSANISISSYVHYNDGAIWIPLVYSKILEFLGNDDRHNMWLAHSKNGITVIRPDPYKFAPDVNPSYILWALRTIPIRISISMYHRCRNRLRYAINMMRKEITAMWNNPMNGLMKPITGNNPIAVRPLYINGRHSIITRHHIITRFDQIQCPLHTTPDLM